MTYTLYRDPTDDGSEEIYRFKNKDEVISQLMYALRNHGERLRLVYPDGWNS